MADEYISKQVFNDAIREAVRKYPNTFYNGLETARQIAHDMSATDVAPVVRCKECYAYRKDKELAKAAYLDGEMYCALLRCEMPQDGFCYYGKRNCGARMDGGEP